MSFLYLRSKFFPFFLLIMCSGFTALAQKSSMMDTAYYMTFPHQLTCRVFASQKYTSFIIAHNGSKLPYRPNTTLNLGIGATYDNFTLNLAYGFGFLNRDANKGATKYLDLQGHFYWPKWVTDFEGQLYRGYHLPTQVAVTPTGYYYRPDMHVTVFGLSQYYLFNWKRFSYRATFLQNEWQKKPAGTLLAGGEMYAGVVKADSNMVPVADRQKFTGVASNEIKYFSIGPGIGYAYTLVLFRHIFFTGSLTGSLNFDWITEQRRAGQASRFSLNPVTRFRVGAGYNGRKWNISANWISDKVPFRGVAAGTVYSFSTGNYRLIIARRLATGPRIQRTLRFIDNL